MKALARGIVWRPGMDGDTEEMVKDECHQCQATANHPLLHRCILGSGLLILGLMFILITQDHFLEKIAWWWQMLTPCG